MRMHLICRVCRGKPSRVLDKFRCGACKQNDAYYTKELPNELVEYDWLYSTWLKCKKYSQISTGIQKLDFVLTMTFGAPHGKGWRDYKQLTPGQKAAFCSDMNIVLRLVGDSSLGRVVGVSA